VAVFWATFATVAIVAGFYNDWPAFALFLIPYARKVREAYPPWLFLGVTVAALGLLATHAYFQWSEWRSTRTQPTPPAKTIPTESGVHLIKDLPTTDPVVLMNAEELRGITPDLQKAFAYAREFLFNTIGSDANQRGGALAVAARALSADFLERYKSAAEELLRSINAADQSLTETTFDDLIQSHSGMQSVYGDAILKILELGSSTHGSPDALLLSAGYAELYERNTDLVAGLKRIRARSRIGVIASHLEQFSNMPKPLELDGLRIKPGPLRIHGSALVNLVRKRSAKEIRLIKGTVVEFKLTIIETKLFGDSWVFTGSAAPGEPGHTVRVEFLPTERTTQAAPLLGLSAIVTVCGAMTDYENIGLVIITDAIIVSVESFGRQT
jgi:hypothetical protein